MVSPAVIYDGKRLKVGPGPWKKVRILITCLLFSSLDPEPPPLVSLTTWFLLYSVLSVSCPYRLGEHSMQIYSEELGLSIKEIKRLMAGGAI
jgi:hypothetical protein